MTQSNSGTARTVRRRGTPPRTALPYRTCTAPYVPPLGDVEVGSQIGQVEADNSVRRSPNAYAALTI